MTTATPTTIPSPRKKMNLYFTFHFRNCADCVQCIYWSQDLLKLTMYTCHNARVQFQMKVQNISYCRSRSSKNLNLVTELARLLDRTILLSVQPGRLGWNSRNKTNMRNTNLYRLRAVADSRQSCNFTQLIRILLKWKHMQDKTYAIQLADMLRKWSYFV